MRNMLHGVCCNILFKQLTDELIFFLCLRLNRFFPSSGHSMVVDPWAKVIKSAADGEETIVADLGT